MTVNTANAVVDSAYSFGTGVTATGYLGYEAFDAMNTLVPPGDICSFNALIMPRGEEIGYAGDLKGLSLTSPPQRILSYNIADTALEYLTNGVGVTFSVLDSGLVKANYGLTVADKFTAPFLTPASSSVARTQGQQEADASYEYICVATNTWKRAALSAF